MTNNIVSGVRGVPQNGMGVRHSGKHHRRVSSHRRDSYTARSETVVLLPKKHGRRIFRRVSTSSMPHSGRSIQLSGIPSQGRTFSFREATDTPIISQRRSLANITNTNTLQNRRIVEQSQLQARSQPVQAHSQPVQAHLSEREGSKLGMIGFGENEGKIIREMRKDNLKSVYEKRLQGILSRGNTGTSVKGDVSLLGGILMGEIGQLILGGESLVGYKYADIENSITSLLSDQNIQKNLVDAETVNRLFELFDLVNNFGKSSQNNLSIDAQMTYARAVADGALLAVVRDNAYTPRQKELVAILGRGWADSFSKDDENKLLQIVIFEFTAVSKGEESLGPLYYQAIEEYLVKLQNKYAEIGEDNSIVTSLFGVLNLIKSKMIDNRGTESVDKGYWN